MHEAGWYADPVRVHEHRYWDGTSWTAHVSDGGVAAVDPLPGAAPSQSAAEVLDVARADLEGRIHGADLDEHPKVELLAAASVASQSLELLVTNPTAVTTFGVHWPDDPRGERLLRAAELHGADPPPTTGAATSCLRVLAFHVLLRLPEDTGARRACAATLAVADDVADVATALGELYRTVVAPSAAEWAVMEELFRSYPAGEWDPAYYDRLQGFLREHLAPGAPPVGEDAAVLLWAAHRAMLHVTAVALYPEITA